MFKNISAAGLMLGLLVPGILLARTTVDDSSIEMKLASQVRTSEIGYARNGEWAAFSTREPGDKLPLKSRIWVYRKGTHQAVPLSNLESDQSVPRISPEGTRIAYIDRTDAKKERVGIAQLGEPGKVVAFETKGAIDIAWLGDGSGIAILAEEDEDPGLEKGMVVGSQYYKRKQIRVLDARTGAVRTLTASAWNVGMFAPIPGSRDVVITAEDELKPEQVVRRLFVVEGNTGAMREFGAIEGVEYDKLRVSPDGRRLAFIGSVDGPTGFDLFVQDIAGEGKAVNLTGPSGSSIDRMVSDYDWVANDSLVVSVQEGFGDRVYRVGMERSKQILKSFDDATLLALGIDGEASLVYAKGSDTAPPEVWISDEAGDRQISRLNNAIPGLVEGEVVAYKSWDGRSIQAKLFKPSKGVAPYPTVMLIHGGPAGRWSNKIIEWAQVLVADGFAVMAPNIRGSSGHSQAFMTSNRADWGGGDFKDVMSGVDWLVENNLSDPDHLGIAGWSYGGYMAAWAVTQTDRFKASVAGAGMIELNLQWGAGLPEVVPYDSWFLGTPWSQPENFSRMSPLTHVKSVKTPTMLIAGEADRVDPALQNWPFHRALRMNGIDTELLIYPRQGHSLLERKHAADAARRTADWMKKYVSKPTATN
ncbi:S9 family peptidase [Pseudoxanthomonas indica]|uniref:Dipeptidyl aminopeptidase/acylaminoacyl peptidase n=1 Tax=Pseudoxanthomonas indica TaxID=428993 RepID=A0A1T5M1Y1_9GAMM|nr:S9 family peptidase [Pseudoxanthomonas indica]GGD60616.1 acyl-peptide hydrolase [Pseudoxanthomonas indica]SKC82230.1 Dipeptidyl aminopeptidase/acylaminoacyl peptidase [Pseudoxanthomonas indica]